MINSKIRFQLTLLLIAVALLMSITGCEQEELPTLVPTAPLPTQPPPTATSANLPPTRDIGPSPTAPPEPTTVPATPTVSPTATAVSPVVNITTPGDGVQFVMGSDVVVSGLAHLEPDQSLHLALVSANGYQLTETTVEIESPHLWQASLRVPEAVSGPAQLQAAIRNDDDNIVTMDLIGVQLVLDTADNDRYLVLFRPAPGETVVAGYNMFFDGRAQLPVNNQVIISIWHEDCRAQAARQSFVLSGSGYWQGFIVVPQNLSGPACAVAQFGEPGELGWREAQIPITIVPAGETAAVSLTIGNPAPGSVVAGGQPLLLYGTLHNLRNGQVLVTVMLENGRILTEAVTTADYWGYWELSVFLPPDAGGVAHINASAGNPTDPGYAQTQSAITIQAAE